MAIVPTSFMSAGKKIAAFLDIPDKMNPPTIIYSHGFTSSGTKEWTPEGAHKVVKTAEKLRSLGFLVLRFDYRGLGKSEGKFMENGLTGEVEDLKAAYDFAKERGFKRISVLGSSLGSAIAILNYDYLKPKSLVLWNPVTNLKTFSLPYQGHLEKKVRNLIKIGESVMFDDNDVKYEIPTTFLKELMDVKDGLRSDLDVQKMLGKIECPTLVVHGTKDEILPIEECQGSFENISSSIKEFIKIEGAGHGFNPLNSEYEKKAIAATVKWFDKYGR